MEEKLWVSFVGVDGCGKTTASQYAAARLAPRSKWWKHPHYDWVRDMMNIIGDNDHGIDVYSDAVLFAAAHRVEQYLLRGWWKEHDILVSQRGPIDYFTFLNADGLSFEACENILRPSDCSIKTPPFPGQFVVPHVVVYLDCDVDRALARILKEDKWEVREFLLRLQDSYTCFFAQPPAMFQESRLYRIDACPAVDVVQQSIDAVVADVKSGKWQEKPCLGAHYVRC